MLWKLLMEICCLPSCHSLQVGSQGVGDLKDLLLHVAGGKNPWHLRFPAFMFARIVVRRSSAGKDCDSGCTPKLFLMQDAEVQSDLKMGEFCAKVELKSWEGMRFPLKNTSQVLPFGFFLFQKYVPCIQSPSKVYEAYLVSYETVFIIFLRAMLLNTSYVWLMST